MRVFCKLPQKHKGVKIARLLSFCVEDKSSPEIVLGQIKILLRKKKNLSYHTFHLIMRCHLKMHQSKKNKKKNAPIKSTSFNYTWLILMLFVLDTKDIPNKAKLYSNISLDNRLNQSLSYVTNQLHI